MPELKLAISAGAHPAAARPAGFVALHGLDMERGKHRLLAETGAAPSPSFLAWSKDKAMLYVASELARGDGRVTGLALGENRLVAGNHVETGGNGAVHLCLDRQGQSLFVANYQGDERSGPVSVAVFALEPDGSLGAMTGSAEHHGHGPDHSRQSRPHCHSVTISPDNRILAAADLGTDSLYLYRFDARAGTISLARQLKLPPGTGPRHGVFHPTHPLFYMTGELNSSLMTVMVDTVSADAELVESIAATAIHADRRNYPSGIAISPDGHYVLAANRGADSIAVYWIDPQSGAARLRHEVPCGGRFPRAIRFDPTARYLAVANQKSDDVSIFGWDFSQGALSDKPLLQIALQTPLDMIFVG